MKYELCRDCDGNGNTECGSCVGSGLNLDTEPGAEEQSCPVCLGAGENICDACEGTGGWFAE